MLDVGSRIQTPLNAKGWTRINLPRFDETIDPKVLQVHIIEPPQSPQKFTINDDYRATTTVSGVTQLSHSEPRRFGVQILPKGVLFAVPQPTTDISVTDSEARLLTMPVKIEIRKPKLVSWLGFYKKDNKNKRSQEESESASDKKTYCRVSY